MVTERIADLVVDGRRIHQVGLPYHWGWKGIATGDSANDLLPLALDSNVHISEFKAATCDVRPGPPAPRPGAARAGRRVPQSRPGSPSAPRRRSPDTLRDARPHLTTPGRSPTLWVVPVKLEGSWTLVAWRRHEEDGTITYPFESSLYPNWSGADQTRQVSGDADELVLRTPPIDGVVNEISSARAH